MPSAEGDAPRRTARRGSLVGRVAVASGLAAAIGGVVAATAAGASAIGLVEAHDDAALRAAAAELVDEIRDELEDDEEHDDAETRAHEVVPRIDPLEAALIDELEETPLPGARAVIRRGATILAGDPDLEGPRVGECRTIAAQAGPRRACSVAFDGLTLTLAIDASAAERQRTLVAWGALIGMIIGSLASGAMSRRFARWALAPLADLRERVASVRPGASESRALDTRYAHAELEELRRAVADLVDRLGAALQEAQAFASEAAHELRTPLATLAAELELLEGGDAPLDAPALGRLRARVADLVALVQRLLVLARAGRLDSTALETVDLGDAVSSVVEALSPGARARLRVELDEDVLVRGDAALLRSMVSNAADNALKFSSGPVSLRVRIADRECVFETSDDGPGIPAAERDRVFAPFYRTASSRASDKPGHGIGLALITHVAAAHGGRVELVDVARGTTLRVTLPAWTASRSI